MTRDRIAAIGFQHPIRSRRPLTPRNIVLAELIMTCALVLSIVVAATAVGIGIARAEAASALISDGRTGAIGIALFLGALIAGMGLITAAVTRHIGGKPE